jgi:Family of unknown function (DUF6494)
MNEDVFNTSIRKFLKTLGVTGQREIEKAVRQAIADGKLKGNETLSAQAIITIGTLQFRHEISEPIELA